MFINVFFNPGFKFWLGTLFLHVGYKETLCSFARLYINSFQSKRAPNTCKSAISFFLPQKRKIF